MSDSIASSLAEAGLVPGPAAVLIPETFEPKTVLSVAFAGRLLALGNLFRASECKTAPHIAFTPEADADENATYTLALFDPDAPTPDDPKFAFWRHWVLPGLKPAGLEHAAVQTKPALTEFLGPGPKDDSKPHRYLFLLFREPPGGLNISKADVGGEEFVDRRSFDPATFVKTNNLQLVGLSWMLGAGDGWKA